MSDDGSKLGNDAQLINKLVEIVVHLMKQLFRCCF